jgi:hypothetical protein
VAPFLPGPGNARQGAPPSLQAPSCGAHRRVRSQSKCSASCEQFHTKIACSCILVVSNQSCNWTPVSRAHRGPQFGGQLQDSWRCIASRPSPRSGTTRPPGCGAFVRACLLLSSMAARRVCSPTMAEVEKAVVRESGARSTCRVRSTRCDATLRRWSVTSRAGTEAAPDHQRYPDELKRPSSREEIPWQ